MYRRKSRVVLRKTMPLWVSGLWLGMLLMGATLFMPQTTPKVEAAPACDWTNVMRCGLNRSSLQSKIDSFRHAYNTNKDSGGRGGIRTAAHWTGYNSSIIAGMNTTNTKVGTFYRDGRIVVGGAQINDASQKTWVTTRYGSNAGRLSLGDGIYARPVPGTQPVDVEVLVTFNRSGVPIAAVMTHCGNTVKFVGVPVVADCVNVAPALVDRSRRLYDFTANTRVQNATLIGGNFTFGDGTSSGGTVNGTSLTARHAYKKDGTYTVVANVRFNVYGYTVSRTCRTSLKVESPGVSIQKTVNGAESKKVSMNKPFTYQLIVKNTSTLPLKNVVVTDDAPKGVLFTKADKGKITDDKKYRHTIPNLAAGAKVRLKITAKVVSYTDKKITNTACVNAPEVNPNNPTKNDACDSAKINLPKPFFECTQLTGPLLSGKTMGYAFTAESKTAHGAVLKRALFVFGDGKSRSVNATPGSSVIATDYIYPKEGKYSAYATLYFDVFGVEKKAEFNCYAKVEPSKPAVPECKPGIPVGDIRCNPCEYDASISKDDPRCVAPATTLPNTGAGNIIALASAALVGGFLWYRHMLFRRHKKAYLAADFGTSPLPLANPFETAEPLAGTPLAPETHSRKLSLRRRRQF
ncbi:hypothetical protein CSA80_04880 [Candidatus Saccharibacteria bacterium]|nr:MAG: hypothetical protein CSA80_04880 [Candidatus Saccharibacteria bacterium]